MSENIYSILTVLLGGGMITAVIAALKFKPDRDSIIVTSAQNATQILKQLNTNLQTEIARQTAKVEDLEAKKMKLDETIEQLVRQIEQLKATIEELQTALGNQHSAPRPEKEGYE